MTRIERLANQVLADHAERIQQLGNDLTFNCEVPAQRLINAAFHDMGITRFPGGGHDVWDYIQCKQRGWDYEKPGQQLCDRWARY